MKNKLKLKIFGIFSGLTIIFTHTIVHVYAGDYQPYDRMQDLIMLDGEKQELSVEKELKYQEVPVKSFTISNLSPDITTNFDYTDWWYSEWEDCRYVFLPVTADRSNLIITYSADETLYLNGQAIKSGEMTSMLVDADTFQITVGDKDCGTLKIMQSNIGCIYLSTSHGGLNTLDNNRSVIITGKALMLNADGGTEYNGNIEKLTAHGNSSWDYSKKKPYNLKLPQKENLYGMGKAKKWALLANYLDHSMMRNKLTEEMCKAAGMEYVMDSAFVDLYADGSYRGTYQLYERVQIQKNRINIRDLEEVTEKLNSRDLNEYTQWVFGADSANEYKENSYKYYDIPNNPEDITGGYLLQFQQWNRYGYKCKSGFVTSRGQAIGIDGPEYASKAQVEYIRSFVQDMEDAIYSDNGYNAKGKHYSDYLDEESLIIAYLVQEISENIDATYSSFYLWKDSDFTGDGKMHFSPAWDFDLAYNNFPTLRVNSDGNIGYSYKPDNLFAAYFPIHGYEDGGQTSSSGSGRPTVGISWIGQLYKQDNFKKRVAEIYFERFEPYLSSLNDNDNLNLFKMAENIRPSAEMNNARWHTYGGASYSVFGSATSGTSFMESVNKVGDYIHHRADWLNDLWKPYTYVKGDVNGDGEFNVSDVALLQKWLLAVPDIPLSQWRAADLCKDDRLDVFDLCLMKRELLYQ
ncbi:CotH kinase family protein [Ruminococcus flavefaciens]|uniref:CotH kinase family protein n=1 Tax=Ruminococcus flavefaciens TaxID=1265 RepID=UPI0026EC3507|nr:CotH kinase family protein [Ruminococcus flavefaciens]